MMLGKYFIGLLAAGVVAGPLATTAAMAKDLFIPMFTYRTGPFAPGGSKVANGFVAYLELLNKRDGIIRLLVPEGDMP